MEWLDSLHLHAVSDRSVDMADKEENMREQAITGMWEETTHAVMAIARNRRVSVSVFDIEEKDFDDKLNDICEEAYKKYGKMSMMEIMYEMMAEELLKKIAAEQESRNGKENS